MRTILPNPEINREEFLQLFTEELQKSTNKTASVRFIGHTLFITLNADPVLVLERIFVPMLDHQPRWSVTHTGWHQVFLNHRTFHSDYPELLNKITVNYNDKRDKRLAKTHRRTSSQST